MKESHSLATVKLAAVAHCVRIVFFLIFYYWISQSCLAAPSSLQDQAAANAQFGRLFTTPAERQRLDAQRQKYGFSTPAITTIDTDSKSDVSIEPASQSVKFSGLLLRADGQQQVWINGKLQPQKARNYAPINTAVPASAIKVPIYKQNRSLSLKPGQVWIPDNRNIIESYLLPANQPSHSAGMSSSKAADDTALKVQTTKTATPINVEADNKSEATSESGKISP